MTVKHWSRDEFRQRAHEVVEFLCDYWDDLKSPAPPWPVLSARKPGETAALLPESPPEAPEAWEAIAADLRSVVLPGLTHWQSPGFFGYFPANISGPSVLGELLSAGLGVQGMLWATSPACTEIETRMLDWMARAVDLPERFLSTSPLGGGVIQGSASDATLVSLLAARQRARARGAAERHIAYTSAQAHSSVVKAAMIAGLVSGAAAHEGAIGLRSEGAGGAAGSGGVRLIGVDERFRMRADLLEEAIMADRAAGRAPFYVAATAGTTSCMAVDDLDAIGAVCARQGVWLHVDGAYAGAACVCPEHRWILKGASGRALDLVDSLCFNPHKALLTNFDCDLFWTADRRALIEALSITPEYLRNAASEAGAVIDYRDWQVPLGRRFRALKLWLVVRSYGLEGLRAHVRGHDEMAELFASLVRGDERFELVAPPGWGLVCFRPRGEDELARRLLERVNGAGRMFLTHTVLDGRWTLRLAIGATFTGPEHVRRAWEETRAALQDVVEGAS